MIWRGSVSAHDGSYIRYDLDDEIRGSIPEIRLREWMQVPAIDGHEVIKMENLCIISVSKVVVKLSKFVSFSLIR